jgi:uncharacterized protein with HEPN domain
MLKDNLVYLNHMLDMARKAIGKVTIKSRADFDADEDLRMVLAHLVQIVGEAERRVSTETREHHPGIPWHKVIGMRHRIVHDYMDINQDILWDVVSSDLRELIPLLEAIVLQGTEM